MNNRPEDGQRGPQRSKKSPLLRRRKKIDRSTVGVCTKYTLFVENCIILLVGLAVTTMSTYILVIKEKVVREYYDFFLDPSCLLCAVGSIVTLMGFLGCAGALRENTCCLKTYYYLLSFILLGELTVAILAFVAYYVDGFQEKLFPKDLLHTAIVKYRDELDMKNLIDDLQQQFECCGLSNNDEGFMDWNDNIYYNCTETNISPERCSVPMSCCKDTSGKMANLRCGANIYLFVNGKVYVNQTTHIYTKGCIKSLNDWFDDHALIAGGVLLGILLPQIFIVILTRSLIDMIRLQKSKW